jgi:hypothetical protein
VAAAREPLWRVGAVGHRRARLEGWGEQIYLISMGDDASSRLLARFVRHDTSEENMRLLSAYLDRFGRLLAFYATRPVCSGGGQDQTAGAARRAGPARAAADADCAGAARDGNRLDSRALAPEPKVASSANF